MSRGDCGDRRPSVCQRANDDKDKRTRRKNTHHQVRRGSAAKQMGSFARQTNSCMPRRPWGAACGCAKDRRLMKEKKKKKEEESPSFWQPRRGSRFPMGRPRHCANSGTQSPVVVPPSDLAFIVAFGRRCSSGGSMRASVYRTGAPTTREWRCHPEP